MATGAYRVDLPCDHVSSASGVRTRRALVRLFSSVCSLVSGEVVASREHLQRKRDSITGNQNVAILNRSYSLEQD